MLCLLAKETFTCDLFLCKTGEDGPTCASCQPEYKRTEGLGKKAVLDKCIFLVADLPL